MNGVVRIDGKGLTIEQVVAVARQKAQVVIDENVERKVDECSEYVKKAVGDGKIIYGVTTGFGERAHVVIRPEEAELLQENLIKSHSVGIGRPLPKEVVRAAILLRANTLTKGYSGIRYETLETLVKMINKDVCPVIPEKGSVGASGDLAPLSHMVLVMMGEGEAYYGETKDPILGIEALKRAGIEKIKLGYKEGLALINGTSIMTAIAALSTYDAEQLVKVADIATAVTLEALTGLKDAFHEKVQEVRPYDGQKKCAKNVRALTEGSKLALFTEEKITLKSVLESLKKTDAGVVLKLNSRELMKRGISSSQLTQKFKKLSEDKTFAEKYGKVKLLEKVTLSDNAKKTIELEIQSDSPQTLLEEIPNIEFTKNEVGIVQDAYSLRAVPQVHGATREAVKFVKEMVKIEINSANDNPLIFVEEDRVLSGANFHGQPIALAMDVLAVALSELGDISERRTFRLLDLKLNNGLPAFLIKKSGLNIGFMMPQYTAASLVAENRILTHPASVGSIPTCANQEDHVSMGTIAARKAMEILKDVQFILSIELLCGAQAIDLRVSEKNPEGKGDLTNVKEMLGLGTRKAYEKIRDNVEYLDTDRILCHDIKKVSRSLVESGELLKAVSDVVELE